MGGAVTHGAGFRRRRRDTKDAHTEKGHKGHRRIGPSASQGQKLQKKQNQRHLDLRCTAFRIVRE